MTSGTKTVDTRTPSPTSCGVGTAGRLITKVWSGTDGAKVPKQVSPQTIEPYWVFDRKKGVYVVKYRRSKTSNPPKRARGRGEHPYTMVARDINNPVGMWASNIPPKTPRTGTMLSCWGANGGNTDLGYYWTANDDIALIASLKEQIRGNDFDPSVFLATSGQALGQITNAAMRIGMAIRSAKRGDFGGMAKDLAGRKHSGGRSKVRPTDDVISREWLGAQYGWLPLINDAKEGAEYVAHQLSVPMQKTYRVHRRRDGPAVGTNGPNIRFAQNLSIYRKQIIARITEKPTFWQLSGIANPANVAWELLPWSFVIDWFIPIGQFIDARGFAGSLQGQFITTVKKERLVGGPFAGPANLFVSIGYSDRTVTLDRTVSSTLSVPMPNFKPLAEVPSWKRTANALALLFQQRHK